MTAPCFVDTNLLVYADDRSAGAKREVALKLLLRLVREGSGVLSLQVLQEYFAAATKRLRIPPEDARRRVVIFGGFDTVVLGVEDLLAAIDLHRLHSLSIWDSLIVRAAIVGGCRTLYTEDLQHGRRFEGLEIVNPFAA